MKIDWNDVKWIFVPDESFRDIYVQEVSIEDWEKVIDLLNENYSLKYDERANKIDKDHVIRYLTDESGEMECGGASVDLGGIAMSAHFFLPDQIEYEFDPREIGSREDFETIETFMTSISETLSNQVTLTWENDIKRPVIIIDVAKGIYSALTEEEDSELNKETNPLRSKFKLLKFMFMMKFFRKRLLRKLSKSGSKPYRSTKKSEIKYKDLF